MKQKTHNHLQRYFPIVVIAVLLAGLLVALKLTGQRQEVRKKADYKAGVVLSIAPNDAGVSFSNLAPSQEFLVDLKVDPVGEKIAMARIEFHYDSTYLEVLNDESGKPDVEYHNKMNTELVERTIEQTGTDRLLLFTVYHIPTPPDANDFAGGLPFTLATVKMKAKAVTSNTDLYFGALKLIGFTDKAQEIADTQLTSTSGLASLRINDVAPGASNTPTPTGTLTPTPSGSPTPTATPTSTPTNTPTNTPTATPTSTPTSTPSSTPTPTSTPIPADPNCFCQASGQCTAACTTKAPNGSVYGCRVFTVPAGKVDHCNRPQRPNGDTDGVSMDLIPYGETQARTFWVNPADYDYYRRIVLGASDLPAYVNADIDNNGDVGRGDLDIIKQYLPKLSP